ncbi:uncharacterized protein BDZ99DRAFT_527185 [Mytilinidion resinicola]|uniref:Uncharacterized protein n=1 Tax=Mytilinidion resinicola TaxID=574789 RepID=A0A6A6Y283_9PEZI|nr:uncharacterized protein BDZ99DRAFT_527185 [Mytilinidion resinicola]KAF2802749.1 hypothetical protein BDZ99DRAFT_527185 [Mytilinidion resinicola]
MDPYNSSINSTTTTTTPTPTTTNIIPHSTQHPTSTIKSPSTQQLNMPAYHAAKVTKYSYNGTWNNKWTKAMDDELVKKYNAGDSCHKIAGTLNSSPNGGPARWESIRDRLKEIFPGKHIKGDDDDAQADHTDDTC